MRFGRLVFPVVLVLVPQSALAEEPALDVRVDPRVELFSVIFRATFRPADCNICLTAQRLTVQ